jgi:hypothetical protein
VLAEKDRADLVRQILRSYDSGELFDERMVRAVGTQLGGAPLKYSGMASDLRPYIRNGGKRIAVRRVAISIADLTNEASLQHDLAEVALDESEPHEVRAMAVFALGRIGDETEKASLKRLVIDSSVNDPDDELKGGALIATWTDHLTAAELFLALTPLTTSISGLYQRFLWSDFTSTIQPEDICIALDWSRRHVNSSPAEVNPLRAAGLAITLAAIPLYQEPGVTDRLADIFLEPAQSYRHNQSIATKFLANPPARRAIARVAITNASDVWTARLLFRVGVVAKEDMAFLLTELGTCTLADVQERIAFLIADIFCANPRTDPDVLDQVLRVREANPTLSRVFQPLLDTVELGPPEAERQKTDYEASYRHFEEPSAPESPPQIDDLLAVAGNDGIFADICYRLGGVSPSWHHPDDELLPHWGNLTSEHQDSVVDAAERYLKTKCPVADLSWIDRGELLYLVMYGFWALDCSASRLRRLLMPWMMQCGEIGCPARSVIPIRITLLMSGIRSCWRPRIEKRPMVSLRCLITLSRERIRLLARFLSSNELCRYLPKLQDCFDSSWERVDSSRERSKRFLVFFSAIRGVLSRVLTEYSRHYHYERNHQRIGDRLFSLM